MTETLLNLVPLYGLYIVGIATFLSCLAMPIPSSLIMLTAGAFSAAGDLSLALTAITAWVGAVIGDQSGYELGKRGANWLSRLGSKAASLQKRAQDLSDRWGGMGIFLSRWLFSPLGPYANFATGAARMNRLKFTLWGAAGELIWVALYVGLGFTFAAQIEAVASFASNISGLLAAGLATAIFAMWLRRAIQSEARSKHTQPLQ